MKETKTKQNKDLTRIAITKFIDIKYKPTEEKLTRKEIKTLQDLNKEFTDFKAILQKNDLVGSEQVITEEIDAFCNTMKPKAELIVREVISDLQLAALKAAEAETQRVQ